MALFSGGLSTTVIKESDARIRIDYQFTDRFALGLAYNWQRLDVGVKDSTATGGFNLDTNGAEISAVPRF